MTRIWVGYHRLHHWVAVDWQHSTNVIPHKLANARRVYRSLDMTELTVPIAEWGPPQFLHYKQVIEAIADADLRQSMVKDMEDFTRAVTPLMEASRSRLHFHRNNTYCRQSIDFGRDRFASPKDSAVRHRTTASSTSTGRETHCYRCGNSLYGEYGTGCDRCGWIVCDCGACGCGYIHN